jgi:hypothetical protein
MLSPETVCLYESMLAGQQWLKDAGYAAIGLGDDDEGDEDDGGAAAAVKESIDIELQLAPWVITRNFYLASQAKGLLKLYGPGDPSGRGEAFSFIRSNNKGIYIRNASNVDGPPIVMLVADAKREGMKFSVADQQAAYKEEINRIWNKQLTCLQSIADIPDPKLEEYAAEDDAATPPSNVKGTIGIYLFV